MSSCLKVIHDGAHPGAVNMKRDADLLAAHQPGDDPILRIYRWEPAAITLGYNQSLEDFADEAVAAAGLGLVKRPTGGRAILHAHELTYCVVGTSPGPLFGDSLHDCYMKINEALLDFLKGLGIEAVVSAGESREEATGMLCFKSAGQHEIRVGSRKIIGSAQRRAAGVFLQHGSILAGPGHLNLPRYVKGQPGVPQVPAEVLAQVTTDLSQVLNRSLDGAALDAMGQHLADAFSRTLDLPLSVYSP